MRRLSAITAALVCALAQPAASHAAFRGPHRAHTATVSAHPVTGTVINDGSYTLTIQTSGRAMGRINAMTKTADRITRQDYSYVWGGGHAEAGVASVGIKGPGYTGRTSGYDCSGSVAAVLAGGGLWPAGGGVPNDAGVISQLLADHLIARGAGTGPDEVTLYDDPGVHIFMNINGRFFGTSDGAGGGSPKGGPGWLDDGAYDAFSRAFRQYHILPGVLGTRTTYGRDLTFQTTAAVGLTAAVALGDRVHVAYANASAGRMLLESLSFVGASTVSATVASVTSNSADLTLSDGQPLAVAVPPGLAAELQGLVVGDTVSVVYTTQKGVTTARSLTVTAQPAPTVPPTPTPTPAPAPAPDPSQITTDPTQTTADPTQPTTDPSQPTTGPTPTTAASSGGAG